MATSFSKECEGIIAELVETRKQFDKASAEHEVIDTAHKESMAKLLNLSNRGDQLKAALHEKVDEQVAKSK
jgi:hypothetical protein